MRGRPRLGLPIGTKLLRALIGLRVWLRRLWVSGQPLTKLHNHVTDEEQCRAHIPILWVVLQRFPKHRVQLIDGSGRLLDAMPPNNGIYVFELRVMTQEEREGNAVTQAAHIHF